MQFVIGYILIILGVLFEVIAVLAWLGVIKPSGVPGVKTLGNATFWDLLIELLRKAPWCAVIGLFLIYAGLKMTGISLP